MNSNQPEEQIERAAPLDFFHTLARFLLLASSAVCLILWVWFWALFFSYFGWPGQWSFGDDLFRQFLFYFPFVYLLAGVVLSIVRVNRWTLIVAAVILNAPLVALAFYVPTRRTPGAYDAIWIAFLALWSLLCATNYRRAVSQSRPLRTQP
ncbi:MAG: hypothetical protein M3268_03215 [Acidobacteriota bacterium]|nr:hypothetical protein [Acidobacteriota bacterium]